MASPRATVFTASHRGDEPHLLREILRTYQVLMSGFARETGIPASRFMLMRLLAVAERDVGVTDLARQLGINAAAVTRQVQEMERQGLIRRRADARDNRRSYVGLSPKGKKLFDKIHEINHALERSIAAALGAEEVAGAARTLAGLRAFLEGSADIAGASPRKQRS